MKTISETTLAQLEKDGIKFVLIASNSTEHWRGDIKGKAGKILTYSLVNLTQPTNLCSPQINYPFTDTYHRFQKWQNFTEDELSELESNRDGGDGYFLESEKVTVVKVYTGEETEEEILEHLQGNPVEL